MQVHTICIIGFFEVLKIWECLIFSFFTTILFLQMLFLNMVAIFHFCSDLHFIPRKANYTVYTI